MFNKSNLLVTIINNHLLRGRQVYRLEEDFEFAFENKKITIKKGFYTDFASIPGILRIFFTPVGKWYRATLVHDFLYCAEVYDRKECDRIFYLALQESGINILKAKIAYLAVRIFGGIVWKRHTSTSIDACREKGYILNVGSFTQ